MKSGATSDQWTIDPTSKAGRATLYDPRGNVALWQPRYSAGLTARTATAAGTGIFFSIAGSGNKTIRVRRFHVSGTVATAASHPDIVLTRTSTATSSGVASALTALPRDSNSGAATATANYYTTLATTGTSQGVVGTGHLVLPITATFAATDQVVGLTWNFGDQYDEGVVLRGTGQCLQANCGTATANAPSFTVYVEWTEED